MTGRGRVGRPPGRGLDGRWSLQQVHHEAGVSRAVAERAVRQRYLDATALSEQDIVVLRVAAALGCGAAAADSGRDRDAIALTRQVLAVSTASGESAAGSGQPGLASARAGWAAGTAGSQQTGAGRVSTLDGAVEAALREGRWADLVLVLFAQEAVLAASVGRLIMALEEHPGQVATTLPLGHWIAQLPSRREARAAAAG